MHPHILKETQKNLDIISRVKENITIPKNLVGLAYIKKKFNIEFKTIRLLIRKNKIQYDELRVSQNDVLSSLKDQPYFLKTTIKKQLKDLGYI